MKASDNTICPLIPTDKKREFQRILTGVMILGIFLLSDTRASIQLDRADYIRLKDGRVVAGKVIEEVPASHVKIRTLEGMLRTFDMHDVLRISKDPNSSIDEVVEYKRSIQPVSRLSVRGQKSPYLAFLLSFLIPGAGQFYNGDYVKGAIQTGLAGAGVVCLLSWGTATGSNYTTSERYRYNYYTGRREFDGWDYNYYYYNRPTTWLHVGAGLAAASWLW